MWVRLTGDPTVFPLEFRIFHSLCLISIASLAYNVPFNFVMGLPVPGWISAVSGALITYLYYRSRYLKLTSGSIGLAAVVANLLFIVNYFYNSGINGPTDVLSALILLIIISMTPHWQHKIWLTVNIIAVVGMHIIEYEYPQLVPNRYNSRLDSFADKTSAYVVVAVLIYYTIKYIRRNYDYEKRKADEKTREMEAQNEYILSQNRQLESINSEKNKLMSIIAHDLRGPLSNIQNYLELVSEYGLDREEREVVESDLLRVTESTLGMLSKLLIWSKAQMDGVTVKLGDLNLLDTLKNTLEMERMLAGKKDITLNYDIAPDIIVVADNDMLQLVVRNLVSNAIKFTPAGGKVVIRAEVVLNECKISIKDNGRGMTPEQQADIFTLKTKPSFGTGKEKGVGLGLILCKEFTEQQGGRIAFESAAGKGSTFYVYMPLG
ncbi:MAG TPA: HAMP domain-containing sensor histidine kinase [Mucilaginibacter sp.]|nr:HAMP domain-containing sensor histidine kinase [Mucilaginibacter sp.]